MAKPNKFPSTTLDWDQLSQNIITTRTPLRIGFVGGGTDIPEYWRDFGGEVVSAAMDKYIYVFLKRHGELFEENLRLNYSEIELRNSVEEVDNMIVKGCLNFLDFKGKIFIGTVSDLPSES